MKYRNIIFDFDGVLAESVEIKTKAFYAIYHKHGEEIAQKVVLHHKENGGMSRYEKFPYYHKSFLNKQLSINEIEILGEEFSKLVVDGVINSNEVPGALWFLKRYKEECNYWIVSATPTYEINEIIYKRNLSQFFIKIYGSPNTKISIVKRIINENNLELGNTVFIGDAMSDYNAAIKNSISFILRKTDENKALFQNYSNFLRYRDYYELDKLIIGEK